MNVEQGCHIVRTNGMSYIYNNASQKAKTCFKLVLVKEYRPVLKLFLVWRQISITLSDFKPVANRACLYPESIISMHGWFGSQDGV